MEDRRELTADDALYKRVHDSFVEKSRKSAYILIPPATRTLFLLQSIGWTVLLFVPGRSFLIALAIALVLAFLGTYAFVRFYTWVVYDLFSLMYSMVVLSTAKEGRKDEVEK